MRATYFSVAAVIAAHASAFSWSSTHPITPVLQWWANFGYCGELSTIMALQQFGGWMGQFDMRAIASGGTQAGSASQYLLGNPDTQREIRTAASIKLNAVVFNGDNDCQAATLATGGCARAFLAWVKVQARAGHPITIAFLDNQCLMGGGTKGAGVPPGCDTAGDEAYDHIMTVLSVSSAFDDALYHDTDVLTFTDHGLYTPASPACPDEPCVSPFVYSSTFSALLATRAQANAVTAPPYSLLSNGAVYGIAHTGPVDPDGELLRVVVTTDLNPQAGERPVLADGASARPALQAVVLNATVYGAPPYAPVTLLLFTHESTVPTSGFAASGAFAAKWSLTASAAGTVSVTLPANNSFKAFFRAVRAPTPIPPPVPAPALAVEAVAAASGFAFPSGIVPFGPSPHKLAFSGSNTENDREVWALAPDQLTASLVSASADPTDLTTVSVGAYASAPLLVWAARSEAPGAPRAVWAADGVDMVCELQFSSPITSPTSFTVAPWGGLLFIGGDADGDARLWSVPASAFSSPVCNRVLPVSLVTPDVDLSSRITRCAGPSTSVVFIGTDSVSGPAIYSLTATATTRLGGTDLPTGGLTSLSPYLRCMYNPTTQRRSIIYTTPAGVVSTLDTTSGASGPLVAVEEYHSATAVSLAGEIVCFAARSAGADSALFCSGTPSAPSGARRMGSAIAVRPGTTWMLPLGGKLYLSCAATSTPFTSPAAAAAAAYHLCVFDLATEVWTVSTAARTITYDSFISVGAHVYFGARASAQASSVLHRTPAL